MRAAALTCFSCKETEIVAGASRYVRSIADIPIDWNGRYTSTSLSVPAKNTSFPILTLAASQHLTLHFDESGGNEVKTYMIEDDKMYLLNVAGNKVKKRKVKSIKTRHSRLRFGNHDYCFHLEK